MIDNSKSNELHTYEYTITDEYGNFVYSVLTDESNKKFKTKKVKLY